MTHPSVVTIDGRSSARRLLAGERLTEVTLPVGSRVVYPRAPLPARRDPLGALRAALDEPLGSEPLSARMTKGARVVVAIEALYRASASALYWLGKALEEILALAKQRDVGRVTVILATGIHRRLLPEEKKLLLRSVRLPSNAEVVEFDAEGPEGLQVVAEVNRHVLGVDPAAATADLTVTLAVTSHPEGGGYTPLVLGLGGYSNARAVVDEGPGALVRIGDAIERKVATFAVELVLDSRHVNPTDLLATNEDDLSSAQWVQLKGLSHLPARAASRFAADHRAHAGVLDVFCGHPGRVGVAAKRRYNEQHAVPLDRPADVVVTGLPAVGPFNSHATLNPILVKHLLQAWVLQQHEGQPLLERGGTVVLLHPCSNRFDHQQHTAYFDFFTKVLHPGLDAEALLQAEAEFVRNPALLTVFRTGHAYHPAHPFLLWRQASRAARELGRVIVVGADNESVPHLLGYETASSVSEALYRARDGANLPRDILCLHNPLTVVCSLPETTRD